MQTLHFTLSFFVNFHKINKMFFIKFNTNSIIF